MNREMELAIEQVASEVKKAIYNEAIEDVAKLSDDNVKDSAIGFGDKITPEGMHIKAKELNLKAYSLGCSCYNCCKEFEEIMNRKPDVIKAALNVGKTDYKNTRPNDDRANVYEREVWNTAIEQCLILNAKFNGSTDVDGAIRRLKK